MLNKLFPKKSTITLSKALELKETLQEKLKSNYNIFKLENSVIKGKKREYNLKKVLSESNDYQEQLVTLKMLIQKANMDIPENEKFCISYYVYLLSEKKAVMQNLQSILKKTYDGPTETDNGAVVYDKPAYSRSEIEDWINKLRKECREIEAKLTSLNTSIIVELPFKTKLV